jgi:putative phosphoribosyl transferase
VFRDRIDAGRRLAHELEHWRGSGAVILGLPRGGVPVAAVVASVLRAPLDVLVVRKVGVPWQPELAVGAVGEGGVAVLNDNVVTGARLEPETVARLVARATQEVEEVLAELGRVSPHVDVSGRVAIVVDDGVATGATVRAAAAVLRHRGAAKVVLATPVAAPEVASRLWEDFDEVVCVDTPHRLGSVGEWYEHFGQVSTGQVREILELAAARSPDGPEA